MPDKTAYSVTGYGIGTTTYSVMTMFFRVWYYLCFAGVPALILVPVVGWLLDVPPTLAANVVLVGMVTLGVTGAVLAILLLFCGLRLRCPFCGLHGEVCGSSGEGLGFLCDHCGLGQGTGYLKLRRVRQWQNGPPEEADE
ncbi:MAG: hypothetical protein JNM56_19765 [Planctomycetia bacterium]|nr:hypothetical protein [Planctomycetia bacterium]